MQTLTTAEELSDAIHEAAAECAGAILSAWSRAGILREAPRGETGEAVEAIMLAVVNTARAHEKSLTGKWG